MTVFMNLTPHEIKIKRTNGSDLVVAPSGQVARLKVEENIETFIDGIPCVSRKLTKIENLPYPSEGVIYIVSSLVKEQLKDRKDVVAPDTLNM